MRSLENRADHTRSATGCKWFFTAAVNPSNTIIECYRPHTPGMHNASRHGTARRMRNYEEKMSVQFGTMMYIAKSPV
jgi:hypothetical protein